MKPVKFLLCALVLILMNLTFAFLLGVLPSSAQCLLWAGSNLFLMGASGVWISVTARRDAVSGLPVAAVGWCAGLAAALLCLGLALFAVNVRTALFLSGILCVSMALAVVTAFHVVRPMPRSEYRPASPFDEKKTGSDSAAAPRRGPFAVSESPRGPHRF